MKKEPMRDQDIKDPPGWAIRFLRWFCRPEMIEDIEGDLVEKYQSKAAQNSDFNANKYFIRQVLLLFRPEIIDFSKLNFLPNNMDMLNKYLQFTYRQLLNAKNYAVINIFGLAVGIAACIIILLYINEEWSYDSFHKDSDAIFRFTTIEREDDVVRHLANAYPPLAPLLSSTFPEMEYVCRYFPKDVSVKNPKNNALNQEDHFFFADSVFFQMFSFEFRQGNAESALIQPNSVVLTQSTARRYFREENPIGKSLILEGSHNVQVTGVIEDIPANSSLQFDFVASMPTLRDVMGDWALDPQNSWYYPPMYTFAKIPKKVDALRIASEMEGFSKQHLNPRLAKQKNFKMQALKDIHFEALEGDLEPATSSSVLFILLGVAFLILTIGCSNYINLTLSKGFQRSREIAIRKVMGAGQRDVLTQLSVESFAYLSIALILALFIVVITLPWFNDIIERDLSLLGNGNLYMAIGTVLLLGLMGIFNAVFPYLAVSRFKLNNVIKSAGAKFTTSKSGSGTFKNGFVIFQFVIAVVLLIATFTIQQQLNFIQQKNLGLQTEQVMIVPIRDDSIQNNFNTAKELFLKIPGVNSVSAISNFPWNRGYYNFKSTISGQGRLIEADLQTLLVEEDFIRTMQMQMLDGRSFSKEFGSDGQNAFILNEAAAKKFNIENIEGLRINMTNLAAGEPKKGEVIGVVKDFHLKSLHHAMEPVVLTISPMSYFLDNFVIRVQTDNLEQHIGQMAKVWQSGISERPFEYFFLDEAFQEFYLKESRLAKIFSYFSILAFIIAGLGMYALVSYLSERRMKEMSIRKILGATILQILGLLSKDFLRLVLIAILIASPLAWIGMNHWLEDFAFRIDLQIWVFILAGLITLVIAIGTVSVRGLKAARVNPVENIKQE